MQTHGSISPPAMHSEEKEKKEEKEEEEEEDIGICICIGQDEARSSHLKDTVKTLNVSSASCQNTFPPTFVLRPAHGHLEDHPPSPPSEKREPILPFFHTTAWLILFSILGTLVRLGLGALTTYPGSPIAGVIWAQFVGCAIMGFLVEAFPLRTLPLYLGLTTGFCGSMTSFSSFLLETFDLLSNTAPAYPRSRGYGVLAALTYVAGTLSVSFGGLQLGAQMAMVGSPPTLVRVVGVLDWVAVVAAGAMWGGAAAMAAVLPRWRHVLISCVFAPLGTLGRFWVGRWLNPSVRKFPLGTFVVNVLGTAVLAGVTAARYTPGGQVRCAVLRGWGDGFCGCFTTVSTLVVEARGLKLKYAHVYTGTSIIVGSCFMVVVLGSYTWSHNVNGYYC